MPNVLPPLSLDEVTQSAEDPFATLNAILTYWSWCSIDVLTVAEPFGIRLDTVSFQARGFCRHHG